MPSLIVERGQERGLTYALDPSVPAVCGREPSNPVVISDPAASRRHFQINFRQGRWYVEDLGSRNGTYLNEDQLIGDAPLEFGARIQVGETVFSFLEEDQNTKGQVGGLMGKTLGGYLILERVGRGGMGTVYKARQISLNRIVALKILSSRLAKDPSFIAQFVAEARAAGALNHPNVVQVFDVGETNGLHFFSMEFMESGAVHDAFASKENSRYPWTEALPLIMDAAEGLVFAERRGIIHRDIKPDNLMLSVDGSVKIADLGLATRTDTEGDGKIFGTPHFVSPEQAQGKQVTHAADIYSLGATFYRVVAGQNPFSGKTVKEILRKQISADPTPIGELVPDFPSDLTAILSKMMAKRVEDRYQSASELLVDLHAFELEHKIELAGGRKSNMPLLITLATVVVGLIAVVGYFLNKDPPEPKTVVKFRPSTAPVNIYTGKTLTNERVLKGIELQMQLAKAQILAQHPSNIEAISLADEAKWLEVATAYENLPKKWDQLVADDPDLDESPPADDSTTVGEAKQDASTIRSKLLELAAAAKQRQVDADAWWSSQRADIEQLIADGSWSAAVKQASEVTKSKEAQQHLPSVPAAQPYLDGVPAKVSAAVNEDWTQLLQQADTQFTGGDPAGALQMVSDWARSVRTSAADLPDLVKIAETSDAWVTKNTAELTAQLTQHLDADRQLYIECYRAVRHIGPHLGDPGDANFVFSFHFGAGADLLETKAQSARTYLYQDRFARKIADLRAIQETFAAFIDQLPTLFKANEGIDGLPGIQSGAKATLKAGKPPTIDAVEIRAAIRGGSMTKKISWSELTARDFGEAFVHPKLATIDPAVLLGLARLFVETDEPVLAEMCLNQAVKGSAQFTPEDETRLRREIAVLKSYDALASANDQPPAERVTAVATWRGKWFTTDSYILHDGRSPAETGPLLTATERAEFLKRFGSRPK